MNITAGVFLLCSILATNSKGTTLNYMMPAQVILDANDGVHYYVDFTGGLVHNDFPLDINDPIRTIKQSDCVLGYDETERMPNGQEKKARYKENN